MPRGPMPYALLSDILGRLAVATAAGVDMRRAWTSEAARVPSRWRPAMEQVAQALAAGTSLSDALARGGDAFPPLVRGMLAAGAETGHEPEACRDLAAFLQRSARHARPLWRAFARLPGIGAERLAELAVWCRVMSMALGTGMDAGRAIDLGSAVAPSLAIDPNVVVRAVRSGHTLGEALSRSGRLPPLLVEAVTVGEMSGTAPEALGRLAKRFDDEATRRFHMAARAAAWAVWAAFALVVILLVFRVFMGYLAILHDAGRPL